MAEVERIDPRKNTAGLPAGGWEEKTMRTWSKAVAALALALLLTACGGNAGAQLPEGGSGTADHRQQEQMDGGVTADAPAEFTVLAGDEQIHQGLVFDEDITITLDTTSTLESRSQILFAGCTFNGDIAVIGDRSGFLRFTEECVFGAGCQITVREATAGVAETTTLEDDLIKLLFTGEAPEVKTETACNVLCMNGQEVVVDGVAYTQEDFAGHQGFCVATVIIDGEKQAVALAVDE